jgi:tetratricopeptide (TPR) repeat protein
MANHQMISAFTPSLMSPQELETILVQRQDLAQELFEKIVLSATTPAKHYALLIGMRGMGKTHLVALIYYRLLAEFDRHPTLKDKLVIAWLREEEWGVDSWLDLVSRILRALAVAEPQSKSLLEELRRISIEDSIERAAASATRLLKEAIGNRTLLLMMENLDDLFKGLREAGQQQFRSFLQAEQCCTILATTPALFTAVQSRTKPFFGFFNPIYLDRLTVPEAIEMLGKIATLGGQEDLASFLQTPLGRARVRAVHHLAGGNPRVYMLFSQFITRDALDSLVEAFMKMLDDLTPYYQARMKELSNQQRKIVELLVDRRHPVMVKEIAADCFIDAGTAASQLRELRKLGYVEAEQNGRESFYELREVLMRLCLEVKKQRGQWVEIFVEFLKIWYPLSERKNQLELMRGTSQYLKDEHLESALLSDEDPCFIGSQRDLQRALKEQQQLVATETLEELFHSKRLTEENYQKLLELVQTDRYSEAQKLLSEIVSQEDRSVEKSDLSFSLRFLEGLKLLAAGKNLKALELFDVVLVEDKSDVNAWSWRGNSLHNLGKYEEAIASYERAISIKPDREEVWSWRGNSLHNLGKYEEAIASYERAISIKPDREEVWSWRGNSLHNLGKYEEAIASYERAISIKPDDHQAIHKKGFAYFKWGKYVESIDCYNQAISIESDYYNSWHDKGLVQFVMGNYEAALNSWQQTFQIIHQLTPRSNDIAGLIQEFLEQLIPRLSLLINPLLPSEAKVATPPPIGISPPPSLINPSIPPSTNSSPPPPFNPSTPPPATPSIPPSTNPSIPPSIDLLPPPFIYSSTFLTQLVTIYQQAQVLPELSTALIATLPQILAPNISDRTADEWLALWQNLLGTEPALEMPLRLMNVAIAYKKQPAQQKRLWLGLAKEERSILNGALGLEES